MIAPIVDQLTPKQKNVFGRYLIYGFEDRLFSVNSMDIKEYIEKYIPAKSDKKKFLVENVLFHLKGH